eukprot:gnl/TRDRNA2_/TRDRNA2_186492_c0_seq1.p1 gnl/TRDRNA2_/TRDRNA2_186492_c0~~gnl/TRDRNA2_/TRDRNA2_186492_c0_seq1.p1  ORF type:complete len:360 (+),score=48.27 gnl/TRDRNA2_/TRDRNA2_186492_c0_seq1:94-1173(+)
MDAKLIKEEASKLIQAKAIQAKESAAKRVREVVRHAADHRYFEPLCSTRHLSIRFYNWDSSRYFGDVLHIVALVLCLAVILRENGTDGVSLKTHLLFSIVFVSRFLNVFFCEQPIYLVIYKVLLLMTTVKIVMIMCIRGARMDRKDSFSLLVLLFPTAVITAVFGQYSVADHGLVVEVLWVFSMYLEALAMLPQYIYCYRDIENSSFLVMAYVLAMGGYQTVFGLNWIYHYIFLPDYLEISSFIAGVLGIGFFSDYLMFKVTNKSALSHFCIRVDDGLRKSEELVQGTLMRCPASHQEAFKGNGSAAEVYGRQATEERELQALVIHHDCEEDVVRPPRRIGNGMNLSTKTTVTSDSEGS